MVTPGRDRCSCVPLQVGVGVAPSIPSAQGLARGKLGRAIVQPISGPAMADGRVGGETLQPILIVLIEAPLVVTDKHTRSNVQ